MRAPDFQMKDLFRVLLWGYSGICLPLGLLLAVLSLFGVVPVTFNGQSMVGVIGFIIALVYIPFTVLVLTVMNSIVLSIGLWIVGLFNRKVAT